MMRAGIFILLFLAGSYGKETRYKRSVVFPLGGTFKLVIGFAVPLKLGIKQSMAMGWNFQFQYPLPTNQTQLNQFPVVVGRDREKREEVLGDRAIAYQAIEGMLNRQGFNGRECLLRTICENAFESLHHEANGLYGRLIHIILTPDYGDGEIEPDLDVQYLEAKQAGDYGVDCGSLFKNCELENGLLDYFSILDH